MVLLFFTLFRIVNSIDVDCPQYESYDDCINRCSTDTDPCAAYLGSCEYVCYYYEENEDITSGQEENNENFDMDTCVENCRKSYCESFGDNGNCYLSQCVSYCSTCEKYGKGCEEYLEEENNSQGCEIDCSESFCSDDTYYYNGFCGDDGQCYYYTSECSYGCDEEGKKCNSPPSKGTPNLEVEISKDSVYLNGEDSATIEATLTYPDGSPAKGIRVYFELNDPKSTGILGKWGLAHKSKTTDENGKASITINFPDLKGISRVYWDDYPYELEVKVYAVNHKTNNEWKVEDSDSITVNSPAPKIDKIEIYPKIVTAYSKYDLTVEISDDKEGPYKYTLSSPTLCGSFDLKEGMNPEEYGGVSFTSKDKRVTLKWNSIERGLTPSELIFAASILENMGSSAMDVGATTLTKAGERRVKKIGVESTVGKLLGWLVPVTETAWNIKGISEDVRHLREIEERTNKAYTGKEGLLLTTDIVISGIKIYVGSLATVSSGVPVVGKAFTYGNDIVQMALGSARDYVDTLAFREKIINSEPQEMPCLLEVRVTDEDGYEDIETISFPVRYVGFKGKGDSDE